jgi:hypothetical protein
MNGLASALFALGVVILAIDLVVLRVILRRRPGRKLIAAGTACLVVAVILLWLLPPRAAG